MDKVPWYNRKICSQLNGQSFEYYSKQDARKGINLCVMSRRTKNIMYQFLDMQVVAVACHCHFFHLKEHLYHLVILSTFFIIDVDALKKNVIKNRDI